MIIIICILLGSDSPSGFIFLPCPLYFFPYSRLSSYRLLFLCLIGWGHSLIGWGHLLGSLIVLGINVPGGWTSLYLWPIPFPVNPLIPNTLSFDLILNSNPYLFLNHRAYYHYYYHLESAVQGRERVRTLSVQRSQPHTTNPLKEEKDKIWDKKERADHANRKASALFLKPASPTPSNTWSLSSFQRDTERVTKVLRYWEVLQRGAANECLWATNAPRRHIPQRQCTAQRMHWVTHNLK